MEDRLACQVASALYYYVFFSRSEPHLGKLIAMQRCATGRTRATFSQRSETTAKPLATSSMKNMFSLTSWCCSTLPTLDSLLETKFYYGIWPSVFL